MIILDMTFEVLVKLNIHFKYLAALSLYCDIIRTYGSNVRKNYNLKFLLHSL